MSLKIHFVYSYADLCPENLGAVSGERDCARTIGAWRSHTKAAGTQQSQMTPGGF